MSTKQMVFTEDIMEKYAVHLPKGVTNGVIFKFVRDVQDTVLKNQGSEVSNAGAFYHYLIRYRDEKL